MPIHPHTHRIMLAPACSSPLGACHRDVPHGSGYCPRHCSLSERHQLDVWQGAHQQSWKSFTAIEKTLDKQALISAMKTREFSKIHMDGISERKLYLIAFENMLHVQGPRSLVSRCHTGTQ